jgi:hypothetical protein
VKTIGSLPALRAALAASLGLTSAACRSTVADDTPRFGCVDPVPILVAGKDTGYDTCQGGTVLRRAVVDCPTAPLPPSMCTSDAAASIIGNCQSNSDCTDGLFGTCVAPPYNNPCFCTYGCTRDSDCASGEICECGDPVGQCVASSCNAGTCGSGDCASYSLQYCPGCTEGFACQSGADNCFSQLDCSDAGLAACSIAPDASARACSAVGPGGSCCNFGRPFVVDHKARVARPAARADWRASCPAPDARGLPTSHRARLTQHWTEAAQMEHASIAAFARFVLQLMALGAPPDLLAEAQRAMQDETEHARLAFSMASAYGGEDIGPGPIATNGCLDAMDLRSVVATTFMEGCVGETVAALEASEALAHLGNHDSPVAAVLATIAADEARHAELAWRSVAWMMKAFGQPAREALEEAMRGALAEAEEWTAKGGAHEDEIALLEHGILSERARGEIRREALRGVVVPLEKGLVDLAGTEGVSRRDVADVRHDPASPVRAGP